MFPDGNDCVEMLLLKLGLDDKILTDRLITTINNVERPPAKSMASTLIKNRSG